MDRNRVLKIVTHQQNTSMGLIAPQNLKHPKNQDMYIYHNYESIECQMCCIMLTCHKVGS